MRYVNDIGVEYQSDFKMCDRGRKQTYICRYPLPESPLCSKQFKSLTPKIHPNSQTAQRYFKCPTCFQILKSII